MKSVVVYFSRFGNTKKVAEAMASVLNAEMWDAREITELPDFDLLLVGSGTYRGRPRKHLMSLIKNVMILEGKKTAAFGTHARRDGAASVLKELLENKGADVLGSWSCRGRFLFMSRRHPSDADLDGARRFAEELKSKL